MLNHIKKVISLHQMNKKLLLSIMMISTYGLILGHSIVPHHHHDEVSEVTHHEHHDHEHENDADEHEGLPEFFSHFIHSLYTPTEIYTSQQILNENIVKKETYKFLIAFCYWAFLEDIPNSHHPPNKVETYPLQSYLQSLSLRAPPVC